MEYVTLRKKWIIRLPLLIASIILSCANYSAAQQFEQQQSQFPLEINLRAAVLHAPPFATVEEQRDGTVVYGGFQPDLLERLSIFAAADNVTLSFNLSTALPQYGSSFDMVASDCATAVENPEESCNKLDMIVGNYYATPDRALRADLSPAWLRSTISTVKFVDKSPGAADFTTLNQASAVGATVCLKDGTFYAGVVKAKFPKVDFKLCPSQRTCLNSLKAEECVLYASDELQLRYMAAWDSSLEVTREQVNTQYIVWPMSFDLDPIVSLLMSRWVFAAVTNATLDELYFKYFQKALCPVGTAGESCELPCDPDHGESNANGVCVCISTKWSGVDCSIKVLEETNMIPLSLMIMAYVMLGINVSLIFGCMGWLFWKRGTTQVRVSQPFFLVLVLAGCLISSSTIIALSMEDNGSGPVPGCMAIPWLYSVGFSITFGTLFAKIRRVYIIFKSAADMRRTIVTVRETLAVIGAVLMVDVTILIVWTIADPLEWQRNIISADQFGAPLESQGFCSSDHWAVFAGVITAMHLLLLAVACYLCYVSRGIPTKFSEGKYVSIAMISNLQIFIVGVPILIILGTDSATSFFVRCVVIWMNDFAVVTLIFGNLIYSVHFDPSKSSKEGVKAAVGSAMQQFRSVRLSSSKFDSNNDIGSSKHSSGYFDPRGLDARPYSRDPRQSMPNSFSSCEAQSQRMIPPMILEGTESEEKSRWSTGISGISDSEMESAPATGQAKATSLQKLDSTGSIHETTDDRDASIEVMPAGNKCPSSESIISSIGTVNSEGFENDEGGGDCRSCQESSEAKSPSNSTARSQSDANADDSNTEQIISDETKPLHSPTIPTPEAARGLPSVKPNKVSPINTETAIKLILDGEMKLASSDPPSSKLAADNSEETLKTLDTTSVPGYTTKKRYVDLQR